MDSYDFEAEETNGRPTRRPYLAPQLITHGTLEQITQTIGKNSGAGDADLQSGGAG